MMSLSIYYKLCLPVPKAQGGMFRLISVSFYLSFITAQKALLRFAFFALCFTLFMFTFSCTHFEFNLMELIHEMKELGRC